MARGRELSQLGSLITVDDSTKNIGVATATPSQKIGIGTPIPNLQSRGGWGCFYIWSYNRIIF